MAEPHPRPGPCSSCRPGAERSWGGRPALPDRPDPEDRLEGDVALAVIARTEAFSAIWADVARSAGAELRQACTAAELPSPAEVCGTILAVGGEESAAGELVEEARARGLAEIVVVGAAVDHRPAVAALRAGAADYFALPPDLEALRAWAVERVQRARSRERAAALTAHERARYDFSRLVGESAPLRGSLERAARIIPRAGATVLITGETGTGKELLAQAIHYNGPRASHPFVEVNCTALPANLLEAELFGYEKGAFTDARSPKPGLFEAAEGGTMFLDEIGDLSLELQAKLLKVLDQKEVRRLGSLRSRHIDVRVMAATHVDLAAAVRERRFREDLFYRLNVVPIQLPPLRDRGDDVLLLAEYFLDRFSFEYDVPRPALTPAIRAAIVGHPWPGNVRELRNAIERAVLLGGGELHARDFFPEPAAPAPGDGGGALPFPASMDDIESAAARAMLERFAGNKRAAADALGISRSRLYRLLGEAM